jgi:hypothetical protein
MTVRQEEELNPTVPDREKEDTPEIPPEAQDDVDVPGAPRGAFAFVIVLAIFYAAYWIITWFEIFVIRGS